jgi:hypothetical protein
MKTKNLLFMIGLISLFGVIESKAQTGNHFDRTETTVTTTEINNTFVGVNSGLNNTSNSNSGFGTSALMNATGGFNSAFGTASLVSNLSGDLNCAFGTRSMESNTSGYENVAMGHRALGGNTTGFENVAIGYAASAVTTGSRNISVGYYTPRNLTSGNDNIFIGSETAIYLASGNFNTMIGKISLDENPSTTTVAGNNTSSTIILADGNSRQRFFVHSNGFAGIGLGNNQIPQNRLELGSGKANTSGLRFRNYTNTNISPLTPAATPKVLSVNGDGDVVLVDDIGGSGSDNDWHLTGNTGTNPTSNFLGTIDNKDLVFRRNNIRSGLLGSSNTSFGADALTATTTSTNNTAIGGSALRGTTTGGWNTAVGHNSLLNNTVGANNTTLGNEALLNLAGGNANVAIGRQSGNNITGGNGNVIIGNSAGPTAAGSISSKLYIDNVQNFGAGRDTPLILGDFATQNLTFNVAASAGGRVKIDRGAANPNSSGLNFARLNSTFVPTDTAAKFLTVDSLGDVVLRNLPTAGTSCNLYSCDGTIATTATPTTGNPNPGLRTVTMGNNNLLFQTNATDDGNGRVYIGSAVNFTPIVAGPNASRHRLFVEGGILTERVKVALRNNLNWADYVFANDYKLMPLNEVETFVKENKHLPGIDSANELVKNGLDVAEMQAKQMGKIEELTLYVIQQNKEIEELKAQVKALIEKNK